MLAKIKKMNFDTFNNISTDNLIAGDIYIVKYDDNTFNEYIIDNNKNKILITSKNAGEIYLDTSKYTNDQPNNTLEKAVNKIHNEIFCWSGDREGKTKFNKINNYKYECLDVKDKNTVYFVTSCVAFTIDLNKIDGNFFKLPLNPDKTYRFYIDWGDGSEEYYFTPVHLYIFTK